MRLLCVGDIHLGRRPARLTGPVLDRVDPDALGPAAAWRRAVDHAIARRVDAVLLAGDVVEQEDDFYEAYGDLRAGVERLVEAGIAVLGVAGNHDVEVLPRLADAVAGFRLLGRGGEWESEVLRGTDGEELRVLGWSFPERRVPTSPLASATFERDARPTLGLLHCDRDQTGSPYAPVRSRELDAAPVEGWLLGHIHRPDRLAGPRPIGYLGSLTGLDPGEPGAHGPWLLTTGPSGFAIEQVPLAPLRWEAVDVPVDDLDVAEDVHARIVRALDELHTRIAGLTHAPAAVGCRVRLVGRTGLRRELERTLDADDPRAAPHERDGIVYFVEDWRLDALPAVDIDELARGNDPVGLLARRIIALRTPDSDERRRLIDAARPRLDEVMRSRDMATLDTDPPDEARTAAILEQAALRALDELLAQREAGP